MALVIILDFTHLEDWEDLLLIWKHIYSLPAGGNLVDVCNLTYGIGRVSLNNVKLVGVDVSQTLFFSWCYTGLDIICVCVCVCVCNILLIVFLCYYSNPDPLRLPSPVCPQLYSDSDISLDIRRQPYTPFPTSLPSSSLIRPVMSP